MTVEVPFAVNATPSEILPAISTTTVITIDGPAGAGKSSVARRLAEKLGFEFLDTGALYRCVTLAALRNDSIDFDGMPLEQLAANLRLELDGNQVIMNGENVSDAIRLPEVSQAIGKVADHPGVRRTLTQLQRKIADGKCMVTEGRDQGTEVFPDSPCKFFLVASPQERALRRQRELSSRGVDISVDEVLAQQLRRDHEDQSRPVGGMRKSADSIEILTDEMDVDQVVDRLYRIAMERLASLNRKCQTKPASDSSSSDSTRGPQA